VFATQGPLVLVDKSGELAVADRMSASSDFASPATVDSDGSIYSVALSGVYSFDPTGKLRWRLPTGNQTGFEFTVFYPPAVGPDGVLYAVCADGALRAIRTSDGHELWRHAADVRTGPSAIMGGAGGALFMLSGINGVHAFDTKSGEELGELRDSKNGEFFAFRETWALGWDFQIQLGAIFSFDTCGRMRWSTLRDARYQDLSGVIALNELLVASKCDVDLKGNCVSPAEVYLYAADVTPVQEPVVAQGAPYLAGADGTIFTVNCEFSSPKANELIAYTSSLKEIWRLDLGAVDNCPVGNGVLDDDGVLYLAHGQNEGGVEC